MIVIGLDLSLTATGLVVYSSKHKRVLGDALIKTKPTKGREYDDQHRHDFIAEQVLMRLDEWPRARVALEGYAFGAPHADTRIPELGGVVRRELWKRNVAFVVYVSSTIKKHATDNGRASKEEMVRAANDAGYACTDHNLADAYWCASLYAFDHT